MALDSGKAAAVAGARASGHVGSSRLIHRSGIGVLQVWRGQHGQKLQYVGSWRHELNDPEDAGEREELDRAMREGRSVRFEGLLDDPGQPGRETVSTDVRISSMSEFEYVVEPDDPHSATVKVRLVNFRPVGELADS